MEKVSIDKPATKSQNGIRCDDDQCQQASGHINGNVLGAEVPEDVGDYAVIGVEAEVAKHSSEGVHAETDQDRRDNHCNEGLETPLLHISIHRNR